MKIKIKQIILFFVIPFNILFGSGCTIDNILGNDDLIKILIVTDGNIVDDKSFNEQSKIGINKFIKDFNTWTPTLSKNNPFYNKKAQLFIDVPSDTRRSTIINCYAKAIFMKTDVIVCSGFVQNNAVLSVQETQTAKNKTNYIFVDGEVNEVRESQKTLAGLLFNAEEAGFMTALNACIWLNANRNLFEDADQLKMSTYGGIEIPAVVNYMYGFYWGIKYFNENLTTTAFLEMTNTLNPNTVSLKPVDFLNLNNQFTGNFDQGSTQSQALNEYLLLHEKAQIIFPVAGEQFLDAVAIIRSNFSNQFNKPRIIGVDVDQSLQFPENKDLILTSALKRIDARVYDTLWHSFGLSEKENHAQDDNFYINDFKKPNYPCGGNCIGFSETDHNRKIYDTLNDYIVNNLLNTKVSQKFQELLTNHHEKWWTYVKDYNPF